MEIIISPESSTARSHGAAGKAHSEKPDDLPVKNQKNRQHGHRYQKDHGHDTVAEFAQLLGAVVLQIGINGNIAGENGGTDA